MTAKAAETRPAIVNWLSEEKARPIRMHLRQFDRKMERSDFLRSYGILLSIIGFILIVFVAMVNRHLLPFHLAEALPTWALTMTKPVIWLGIVGAIALCLGVYALLISHWQRGDSKAALLDLVQGYEGIIFGKTSEPYGDYVLLQRQSLLSCTGIPHLRLHSLKHFKQVWPRELDEKHLALIRAEIPQQAS